MGEEGEGETAGAAVLTMAAGTGGRWGRGLVG